MNKEELIKFAKFYRENWHKMHHKNSTQAVNYYLNFLKSSPSHETPKVIINKDEKEVCGCNAPAYLDEHRDLRCTQCDEILDYR